MPTIMLLQDRDHLTADQGHYRGHDTWYDLSMIRGLGPLLTVVDHQLAFGLNDKSVTF
jgi:hypothetical protein